MKMNGEYVLLSTEKRVGIKDPTKVYPMVLLMQGTETLDCMTDEAVYNELQAIPQYSKVFCTFDYNHRFKSLRLSVAKISK